MRSSISSWAFALALVAAGGWSATSVAQLEGVPDAAGNAAGGAQEAANDIGGQAGQVTPEVPNSPAVPSQSPTQGPEIPSPTQVPEGAQDTTDGAIQEGRSALDDAEQRGSDALEQTEDATERATGQAEEQLNEAAEQTREGAEIATDQAENAADQARESGENAAEHAREGAEEAAGQTQQAFEELDSEQQAELRENAEFNDEVNEAISSDVGMNLEASTQADQEGLRVSNVQEQSLAAQAGLQQGDVIVSVDGRRFNDNRLFNEYLWRHGYNRIPIVVIRNGSRQTIWWNNYPNRWNNYFAGPGYGYGYRDDYRRGGYAQQGPQGGLGVLVIDNQGSQGGVFVQAVHQNSPAEQAGVQPGDVILAINGRSFNSTRQFVDAIRDMDPNAEVRLDILRENGQETSLTAQLSSRQEALGGQYTEAQLAARDQGQSQTVLRPQFDGQGSQQIAPSSQQAQPQSPQYQAQSSDVEQQRIQELEQQVQELQQQIREMENGEQGR